MKALIKENINVNNKNIGNKIKTPSSGMTNILTIIN